MSTNGPNNGVRFRSNSGGGIPHNPPKIRKQQSEYIPTTGLGTIPSSRDVDFAKRRSNNNNKMRGTAPKMNKLISAPAFSHFKKAPQNIASYEYLSESDESFKENNGLTVEGDAESSELNQIQVKLKQWIGNEEFVTLDQFIELMLKIATGVSTEKATEIFNQIDQWNDGQIESKVLIHNNFLPQMILVLTASISNTVYTVTFTHSL